MPRDWVAIKDASYWKNYSDKTYGFEFKYPSSWELESTEGSQIPTQNKMSFSFLTPKPRDTYILFTIVPMSEKEWLDFSKGDRSFRWLASKNGQMYVAMWPNGYAIPSEFKTDFETIISTFILTR